MTKMETTVKGGGGGGALHQSTKGGSQQQDALLMASGKKVLPQASADQIRIAKLLTVTQSNDDAILIESVQKVIEATGCDEDSALMTLHDTDGDVTKAVNALMDSESVTARENQWHTNVTKSHKSVASNAAAGGHVQITTVAGGANAVLGAGVRRDSATRSSTGDGGNALQELSVDTETHVTTPQHQRRFNNSGATRGGSSRYNGGNNNRNSTTAAGSSSNKSDDSGVSPAVYHQDNNSDDWNVSVAGVGGVSVESTGVVGEGIGRGRGGRDFGGGRMGRRGGGARRGGAAGASLFVRGRGGYYHGGGNDGVLVEGCVSGVGVSECKEKDEVLGDVTRTKDNDDAWDDATDIESADVWHGEPLEFTNSKQQLAATASNCGAISSGHHEQLITNTIDLQTTAIQGQQQQDVTNFKSTNTCQVQPTVITDDGIDLTLMQECKDDILCFTTMTSGGKREVLTKPPQPHCIPSQPVELAYSLRKSVCAAFSKNNKFMRNKLRTSAKFGVNSTCCFQFGDVPTLISAEDLFEQCFRAPVSNNTRPKLVENKEVQFPALPVISGDVYDEVEIEEEQMRFECETLQINTTSAVNNNIPVESSHQPALHEEFMNNCQLQSNVDLAQGESMEEIMSSTSPVVGVNQSLERSNKERTISSSSTTAGVQSSDEMRTAASAELMDSSSQARILISSGSNSATTLTGISSLNNNTGNNYTISPKKVIQSVSNKSSTGGNFIPQQPCQYYTSPPLSRHEYHLSSNIAYDGNILQQQDFYQQPDVKSTLDQQRLVQAAIINQQQQTVPIIVSTGPMQHYNMQHTVAAPQSSFYYTPVSSSNANITSNLSDDGSLYQSQHAVVTQQQHQPQHSYVLLPTQPPALNYNNQTGAQGQSAVVDLGGHDSVVINNAATSPHQAAAQVASQPRFGGPPGGGSYGTGLDVMGQSAGGYVTNYNHMGVKPDNLMMQQHSIIGGGTSGIGVGGYPTPNIMVGAGNTNSNPNTNKLLSSNTIGGLGAQQASNQSVANLQQQLHNPILGGGSSNASDVYNHHAQQQAQIHLQQQQSNNVAGMNMFNGLAGGNVGGNQATMQQYLIHIQQLLSTPQGLQLLQQFQHHQQQAAVVAAAHQQQHGAGMGGMAASPSGGGWQQQQQGGVLQTTQQDYSNKNQQPGSSRNVNNNKPQYGGGGPANNNNNNNNPDGSSNNTASAGQYWPQ